MRWVLCVGDDDDESEWRNGGRGRAAFYIDEAVVSGGARNKVATQQDAQKAVT